jgi:hypothetical protein
MDSENGYELYYGTVIKGVSWYCEIASNVDSSGLKAANKFTIRIPVDADCGGKTYLDPVAYAKTADPANTFTLKSGTIIVRGEVSEETAKPADLKKEFAEFVTVLGVTDNHRARQAKHFKVVGT